MYIYVYIYTYIHTHIHICIYIYIYITVLPSQNASRSRNFSSLNCLPDSPSPDVASERSARLSPGSASINASTAASASLVASTTSGASIAWVHQAFSTQGPTPRKESSPCRSESLPLPRGVPETAHRYSQERRRAMADDFAVADSTIWAKRTRLYIYLYIYLSIYLGLVYICIYVYAGDGPPVFAGEESCHGRGFGCRRFNHLGKTHAFIYLSLYLSIYLSRSRIHMHICIRRRRPTGVRKRGDVPWRMIWQLQTPPSRQAHERS